MSNSSQAILFIGERVYILSIDAIGYVCGNTWKAVRVWRLVDGMVEYTWHSFADLTPMSDNDYADYKSKGGKAK